MSFFPGMSQSMFRINMNNLLKFLGLLILIAAIPVTLYLARHPQILKGRATGNPPMEFFGSGVSAGNPPITNNQNVQLRLTYVGTSPTTTPTPTPTNDNECFFNLTDGQIVSGDVAVLVTARKLNPSDYLSLQIPDSKLGNFQALSTQASVLVANLSSTDLFQNGQATIECRIQTEPGGGTIIYSKQVSINIQN